jgi:PAS domain S-box-containing protein
MVKKTILAVTLMLTSCQTMGTGDGRPSQAAILMMQIGAVVILAILSLLWLRFLSLKGLLAGKTQQTIDSEEKYRFITENTSDVIWILNLSTNKFSYISPAIYPLRGYTPEEAMQQELSETLTLESLEYLQAKSPSRRQEFIENPDGQKHYIDEVQQPCKNGTIIWVETSTQFQYNAAGEIETIGISRDISDRKQAEEALQDSERLLRQIAENFPNSYLSIIEKDFKIGFSSGQEFSKQNLDPQDFIGLNVADVFGDKSDIVRSYYEKAFSGEEQTFELNFNGQHQYYRAMPLFDEDGSVPRILAVGENITERRQAAQVLEQAQLELERSVGERTQELAVRVKQVEKLNLAMSNLLADLRTNQHSLEVAQKKLQTAHDQLKEERVHEQAALLNLTQGFLGLNSRKGILSFAVQEAALALEAEFSVVALVDKSRKSFRTRAWHGWPAEFQPKLEASLDSNLIMAAVIRENRPLVIGAHEQRGVYEYPKFMDKVGISSMLLAPLSTGDQAIGGLAIHDRKSRSWSQAEIRLLSLIANATSQAIERARLFEAERLQRLESEMLREAGATVVSTLDIDEILERILEFMAISVGFSSAAIFMTEYVDEADLIVPHMSILAAKGFPNIPELKKLKYPIDNPLFEHIFDTRKALILADSSENQHFAGWGYSSKPHGWLGVPLVSDNKVIGIITLEGEDVNRYDEHDSLIAQAFANQTAAAILNARLFSQVKEGRQRLMRLSHRLVEIQEQERRRIARELHDEVGQTLTALTISLESMSHLTIDTDLHEQIQDFQNLTQELITQINQLSIELRPRVLDDLGLEPGLAALTNRLSRQSGIEIDFKHGQMDRRHITPEIEINAYRLVQESLTNIIRHAGIDQASVRLWMDKDMLWVQVQDDGQGFDLQSALKAQHSMGLIGMTERVDLLGGNLTIDTAPGEGTAIKVGFPLDEKILEGRKYAQDENPIGG